MAQGQRYEYGASEVLSRSFNEDRDALAVVNADQDEIDRILNNYKLNYVYRDDISLGPRGWKYQFDSTGRTGITLSEEARKGNYSILMHTRAAASDEGWMRKGVRLPNGVKKVIKGCYWMFHAANANNPATINFEFDTQIDQNTTRRYFSVRYHNHNGTALQTKWEVNTGTPTSQSWTAITGATENIPWNESEKPMLNYMVMVLNLETFKYETLYSNGNVYDISAQNIGPTAGTSLANFDMGAVDINAVKNRSNSSEQCLVWVERPFLAYVY